MTFWSDVDWRNLESDAIPVHPFREDRIEEAKYVLSVGDEVYVSSDKPNTTISQLKENEAFSIAPGQFAYILTDERVNIPTDVIGFISINARVKFQGLVNISGFHVDPGYTGKLIFSVFNAGPTPIHLRRGQAIFPLWLAKLTHTTNAKPKIGYTKIDSSLISSISGNYTSVYQVSEVTKNINKELRDFRHEYDKTRIELANANLEIAAIKSQRIYLGIIILIGSVLLAAFVNAGFRYAFDRLPGVTANTSVPGTTSAPSSPPVVPRQPIERPN